MRLRSLLLSLLLCLPVWGQIRPVGQEGPITRIGAGSRGGIRIISQAVPWDREVHLWRNHATAESRANEYEVYVPYGFDGRYAVFSFRDYLSNGVTNFGRIKEGIVCSEQMHTAATKSGTWTTTTPIGVYTSAAYSVNAGDTITFTVTGSTLVLRTSTVSNGGFVTVAIDGDYTAATRLPAVTQADVDAGYFAIDDIGKRYIDTYGGFADEHYPLAEGLANTQHTVTVRAQGTKRAESSGLRAYVVSVGGATGLLTPGTAGTAMYYTRDITNLRSGNTFSALGVVPEFNPDGFANYQFIGENHGHEAQTSGVWKVDGAETTLAANAYASGDTITLERVTTLTHPSTGATVVATKDATFSFSATRDYPARLAYTLTWSNAGTVQRGYHGMLHVGWRPRGGVPALQQTEFTTALVGSTVVSDLTANADGSLGATQALYVKFYSAAQPTTVEVRADATNVNGWAAGPQAYAFIQDRSDGTDKAYFARSNIGSTEAVAVNDVHSGVVEWRLARQPQ